MGHIVGEGRGQSALFPLCVEDLMPADHACRVIDAFVDSLDMTALGFVRSQATSTGRPGYDPRDRLKLYLYGYLQQVRSSRRLETQCRRNIEVMWLLGRLVPDHKVIAEFRRMHRKAVTETGVSLIPWARAQAMLNGGWVAIDGSKFRSVSSTRSVAAAREAMQRYLAGLDDADQAIPPPDHPAPEARWMRSVQEGKVAAYNVQTAVDAVTGLIVAHEVTTEATDSRSLLPMAQKAPEAVNTDELHVVADTGYSSGEQARACEDRGIVTHVPAHRAVNNQGDGTLHDRGAFAYDEATDSMTCPTGARLLRKQVQRDRCMVLYAAPETTCGRCAMKSACTTAKRRIVSRHWDEDVLQRMHVRATPEAMRLRRCTVERPFAELKERLLGRRFLLRGLEGTQCEMALAVMAFHLKRLTSLLGAVTLIGQLQPA